MLFAVSGNGERVEPTPKARGRCPQCSALVFAKCGTLVAWHWAHRAAECDSWAEGETEWHLGWKRYAEPAACEVVMSDHRADIRTRAGLVVELQHSPIDPTTIAERESFYDPLVWLFDARDYELRLYPRGARLDFEWSRPRKALLAVRKTLYWDVGSGFVLRVEALTPDSPLGGFRGSGVLVDSACFASSVLGSSARPEVHRSALARANRVRACTALAERILRDDPAQGIDEAFRSAMRRTGETRA